MTSVLQSVLLFSLGLFWSFASADLPPEIPKCRAGDVDCIAKTMTDLLHRYPKGNAQFGLPPIDKLSLQNVALSGANGNGPIQLQLTLNKADVYGLEHVNINRVVGFEDDLEKSKFEVYGHIPNLLIKGDYETKGRILLLPITGKGGSEFQLKNSKFGMKVKVDSQIKDGRRYVVVKKIKVKLEPEHLNVQLNNLFNGNKELGESMNRVINENWKDIWNELGAGINDFVERLFSELVQDVLKQLSYDDFYKKD